MSSKKAILVVEDSDEIRSQIGQFYQSEGYEVMLAIDGKDALEKLNSVKELPGVILLDIMMPVMDGFQFRQEQEKSARLQTIPVLAMTADASADIKALKMGAKGYLRKPVELSTLLKVAQKFCD